MHAYFNHLMFHNVSLNLFTDGSRCDSPTSVDAYEAGRAELIRFPHSQLHTMLEHLLEKDNVNLTVLPYTAAVSSELC